VDTRGSRMDGTDCAAAEPWGGRGRWRRRGHGPEFGTGRTVEGVKLAIEGRYEDDVEDSEGE
jgi:hypothetical protein